MGGFFSRIWGWLFSDDKSGTPTFGHPDLHPIDTARLAKELDVEREAERLGKKDIPASEAQVPTAIEYKIIQVIEKTRQQYADWGALRARILNATVANTDITLLCQRGLQLGEEFERKAGTLLNDWRSTLLQQSKAIEDVNTEYVAFQKANGLSNPAMIPSSGEHFFRLMLLAVLILIEGGVNSQFFAQGMWGGFLDGLFYALMFAFGNIALAFVYGRFFIPQLWHRSILRKAAGVLLLIAALAAIGAVALMIAHYRDAVSGGSSDAAWRIAWETFRATPFDLKDMQSVWLCGISVGFALAAVYDAFGLDDPYPGYGAITRRRNRAIDDHATELTIVRSELETLKADFLKEVDTVVDRMRVSLHQLDEAVAQKIEVSGKLNRAFIDVDNCLDALLHRFRTSNSLHRQSPEPAYFSERPKLREVSRPDFSVEFDRSKYEAQKQKMLEVEAQVPRIRASIQSSYDRIFDGLKPLDEHFSGLTPAPT